MSAPSKAILASVSALACAAVIVACVPSPPGTADVTAETIRISGSGTAMPLVRLLADAYPDSGVEFQYLPGVHSGGGISGVAMGELDLGVVSRGLEDDERDLDVELTVLADDALGIAVNPTASIEAVTSDDIREIYSGEVREWSDLGGPAETIIVLDRPEEESAKKVLRRAILGDDFQVVEDAVQLSYEDDMLDGIESTPASIGYVSYGMGRVRDADIDFLSLDGVSPSVDSIESGRYPMVRGLGVVTVPDPPEHVRAFLDWAASEEAAELMASMGYAPRGER